MGKVLPTAWPLVLSGTVPELAGGGDRAAALRTLDSALQQKPGDSWLVIAQAQVYMQIGDFPRALGLLDDALASATTPVDRRTALYYRGHANFNLGNYAQAADDFDASLAGRTTLKSRLGAAAVALCRPGPRPARRARRARQGHRQREPLRVARPDRQVPARQAAGRRARGRGRIRRDRQAQQRQVPGRVLHRHGRRTARRQAARARAAPARPGALPDRVRTQLGRVERAEAALAPPIGSRSGPPEFDLIRRSRDQMPLAPAAPRSGRSPTGHRPAAAGAGCGRSRAPGASRNSRRPCRR